MADLAAAIAKAPPSAREECLKALDSETYDEYQSNRQEALKK